MAEHATTKAIRAVITASGSNGKRYVPGSWIHAGHHMDWTERCPKPRCPHENNECHAARSGLFPDLTEPSTPPAMTSSEGTDASDSTRAHNSVKEASDA